MTDDRAAVVLSDICAAADVLDEKLWVLEQLVQDTPERADGKLLALTVTAQRDTLPDLKRAVAASFRLWRHQTPVDNPGC